MLSLIVLISIYILLLPIIWQQLLALVVRGALHKLEIVCLLVGYSYAPVQEFLSFGGIWLSSQSENTD